MVLLQRKTLCWISWMVDFVDEDGICFRCWDLLMYTIVWICKLPIYSSVYHMAQNEVPEENVQKHTKLQVARS